MSNQIIVTSPNDIDVTDTIASTDIQAMWNIPSQQIVDAQRAAAIANTRHGLLSGIPIICKDLHCPFLQVCNVDPNNRMLGTRCPQEIGALLTRFEQLCTEFAITPNDYVDLGQIKELVDLEIMMLRCDNKMAMDASFIDKTVKDIAKNGTVLYEDQISKATELKLSLIEKHSKILKDLNGTRSSKKQVNSVIDPSQQAASLIAKAKELQLKIDSMQIEVIDGDFIEADEDDLGPQYIVEGDE